MNAAKQQALGNKLVFIATNATQYTDFQTYDAAPHPKMMFGRQGRWTYLAGEVFGNYQQVCADLLKDQTWRDKFSEKYIDNGVHQILAKTLDDGDASHAEQYLADFIRECEAYNTQHIVYLPVDGVGMQDVDQLPLGPITLRRMVGPELDDFQAQVEASVAKEVPLPKEQEASLQSWREKVFPFLSGHVVATYTAIAESTRAQQRAEDEWQRVVEVLRYFIFVAVQKNMDIGIGLRGDVRYGIGEALIVPADYRGFSLVQTSKSPRALIITPQLVTAMQGAGVFALCDLLQPDSRTRFKETLLRGVHWVADAVTQVEPANEFLSLVSCLETFLTRNVGDATSISNAVAVGVGWVLEGEPRNRVKRLALRERVKKLYDKRSTITHGGDPADLAAELPWLRDIVGRFVSRVIARRDEFAADGKQALHTWIDESPGR